MLAAAGRAVYSWYVPIGDDPLAAVPLRTDTADRSATEKAPTFTTEADNLAMLIHRDSSSNLGRVIEASLGRKIEQSDTYKSQLLRLLSPSEEGHTRVRAAMELASFDPDALERSLPEIARQLQSESPERDQVVLAVVRLLATIGPTIEVGLREQLKETADPSLSTGLLYALTTA